MGNQMRKKLSKEDCKFLEEHTDFKKPHIMDFYKDFMVRLTTNITNFDCCT